MLNQILQGNCIEIMNQLPPASVDLIFADPPYNLQLQNELLRPNQTVVDAVNDGWDQFESFAAYDDFTRAWLGAARRLLKPSGTIWVIGSYHNIFRVGSLMMDLGFWILNDAIWLKANPMPNFRGTRFTNATETLIWAKQSATQKRYTFNYHAMKHFNEDKQMTNVWEIPICSGAERIKIDGKKAHSTQKPEALLYRVISASSNVGDVVLDPFFGSGTTGAVAKKLKRYYIGIEQEAKYIQIAQARLDAIPEPMFEDRLLTTPSKRNKPRVKFSALIENGFLQVGQIVYSSDRRHSATIHSDGTLVTPDVKGSIHQVAAHVLNQSAYNGWDFWYVDDGEKGLISIDYLREQFRQTNTNKTLEEGLKPSPEWVN